jgi:hypothetical protein
MKTTATDNASTSVAVDVRKIERRDCSIPHAPFRPASRRGGHTAKLPWHERKLPEAWDVDEVQFFGNWMRELARLHQALISVAADRPKLLRRARKRYMKLGYGLKEPIWEAAIRANEEASPKNAREAVRE